MPSRKSNDPASKLEIKLNHRSPIPGLSPISIGLKLIKIEELEELAFFGAAGHDTAVQLAGKLLKYFFLDLSFELFEKDKITATIIIRFQKDQPPAPLKVITPLAWLQSCDPTSSDQDTRLTPEPRCKCRISRRRYQHGSGVCSRTTQNIAYSKCTHLLG